MSQPTRKLAAIMFTDIVGFTDLTATDEAIALKLLQWQRETFQPLIAAHGGEWLKEVGDGLLLSFTSSQDAVRCAIRIQDAVGEGPNLKLRIGIHQGDIVQDGADILGDGVNMASRIEAVAPAGGIAFSEKVQQDIAGYPEFETVSLGEYALKGASRPVTLHCLVPYGLPNIPEYKLLCRTGAGAYGEVWLAQTLTGIYRAIKIVRRSQFEDERPYEREFKGITEYEPVSRKSDGLIDLLHVGRSDADDFFYYVMELADGQRPSTEINVASYHPKTLQSELESRGRLTIEECLKHGRHLAQALAFLHGQNLVHRDIKPANIVFVNGQPKLADIGLVTTMDNASTLVGTMGYIPPEGPGKPSSDIYALGMVLYELGTGKDRADFPEIDVMDPALKGLNQVCLKACSNDLSERFSDANALADELDRLTHEPPGGTIATSTSGSFYKVAALAAGLMVILMLIFPPWETSPSPKVDPPDGSAIQVITVSGNPEKFGKIDGPREGSILHDPHTIAINRKGNALVSEHANSDIREITAEEFVTSTLAEDLSRATGLCVDPEGNVFVTLFSKGDILRITPDGKRRTVLSGLNRPCAVAVDKAGVMWVANTYSSEIIRITPNGVRTVWEGMMAHHIALGPNDDLYVACQTDQTIRRIGANDSPQKAVEIVAGIPRQKGHVDGPAAQALFTAVQGITVSASGTVYVGDSTLIRRISPGGQVSTLAGDPIQWRTQKEPTDITSFGPLAGLAIDSKGNLWMAIRPTVVKLVINAEPDLQKRKSVSDDSLTTGLVAYYPFNGNAKDESGNGNDGEVKGAVLIPDRRGKPDSAYSYPNNASVFVQDHPSLRPEKITLSGWIKPPSKNRPWYILSKQSQRNQNEQYALSVFQRIVRHGAGQGDEAGSSTIDFAIKRNSGGRVGDSWWRPIVTSNVPINVWSHVVGTWDGLEQKVYLDGKQVGTAGDTPDGGMDDIAGGDITITGGASDDIRIYNRALSSDEVKHLYEYEKPKK